MVPEIHYLLFLVSDGQLRRVALSVDPNSLPEGCVEYYNEMTSRAHFMSLLPAWLHGCTLVYVEEIDGAVVI